MRWSGSSSVNGATKSLILHSHPLGKSNPCCVSLLLNGQVQPSKLVTFLLEDMSSVLFSKKEGGIALCDEGKVKDPKKHPRNNMQYRLHRSEQPLFKLRVTDAFLLMPFPK
jgi:hypothetical protein